MKSTIPTPIDTSERLLLKQSIKIKSPLNKIAGQYNKIKKIPSNRSIFPIINSFDLNNLPTGNYELCIELINKDNSPLTQKYCMIFKEQILNNSMRLDRLKCGTYK